MKQVDISQHQSQAPSWNNSDLISLSFLLRVQMNTDNQMPISIKLIIERISVDIHKATNPLHFPLIYIFRMPSKPSLTYTFLLPECTSQEQSFAYCSLCTSVALQSRYSCQTVGLSTVGKGQSWESVESPLVATSQRVLALETAWS